MRSLSRLIVPFAVLLSSCGSDKKCHTSINVDYSSGDTAPCSVAFADNTLGGNTTCSDGSFDRSVCQVSCDINTAIEPPSCYCDLSYNVTLDGHCIATVLTSCCDCLSASNCLPQQTDEQCKIALDSGGTIYTAVSCGDQNICHAQCANAITGYGH